MADKASLRISKPISKYGELSFLLMVSTADNVTAALAKIMVYSMSLDGPIRGDAGANAYEGTSTPQGFLAGSRALDTLDKLITSTESFFHPSNAGHWTLAVSIPSHLQPTYSPT